MEAKTLLAAAELVDPTEKWKLSVSGNVVSEKIDKRPQKQFNPLTNPADAYALWKALAQSGINIKYCTVFNQWQWHNAITDNGRLHCKTDIEAMLSAVETLEAMK